MKEKTWEAVLWNRSWNYFNDPKEKKYTVSGSCQFSPSKGALLEIPSGDISITRELQETGCYKEELELVYYKHLYGITQDGFRLVLSDVYSIRTEQSIPGGTYEILSADMVLSSRCEFDPDVPIIAAEFVIEGIREWFNFKYYSKIESDPREIRCPKVHGVLDVCHTDNYTMTLHCSTGKTPSDKNDIEISPYVMVHIDYVRGVSLNDFWTGELWRFQAFLTFCFGAYPAINQVKVTFSDNKCPVNVYRKSVPTEKLKKNFQRVPVPFRLVRENLSKVVTQWMKMQGDEARSSEMLASLLGPWEMPIDLQLFMATSMLESLVRSKSEKLYSNDELNSLINPMLAVADEKIRDRARELLRSLQRPPYRMLLNLAFKESETWGTEIVPNQNEFIKKQGKLRNAGAHALGNGGEYDIMVDHYYAQILIAYVIIMKRLGLDDALEQFEESSFLEAPRQQIRERYAIAKTKDTTDTA